MRFTKWHGLSIFVIALAASSIFFLPDLTREDPVITSATPESTRTISIPKTNTPSPTLESTQTPTFTPSSTATLISTATRRPTSTFTQTPEPPRPIPPTNTPGPTGEGYIGGGTPWNYTQTPVYTPGVPQP